jgi:hypothetical protein
MKTKYIKLFEEFQEENEPYQKLLSMIESNPKLLDVNISGFVSIAIGMQEAFIKYLKMEDGKLIAVYDIDSPEGTGEVFEEEEEVSFLRDTDIDSIYNFLKDK